MVDGLDAKFMALMAMKPVAVKDVPSTAPKKGVYLFEERGHAMYVGRTRKGIRDRIREHVGTADDCPFAWRLAREATGMWPTYRKKGSRAELLKHPVFMAAYGAAKRKIRGMTVRYVEDKDATTQALLEIYVAVATGAKHNHFHTT
jgi:hypothetical protein